MQFTNLNGKNYNNEIINDLNKNNNNINQEVKDENPEKIINSKNNNSNSINENTNISIKNANIIAKNEIYINDKYYLEIKKYLDFEERNTDYTNLLKNNPDILFELINEGTIMLWQSKLYNYELNDIDSDAEILTTEPERKDQKIIKNDSRRTRVRESFLLPGFPKILEEFITFYCNKKNINYKQGLNEIFGPLILMKYKIKNIKWINIINIGDAFIDKFLPNYYYERELFSLKSSISLFVILLKYHEPNIYNYLDTLEISHELYATNWMLTLMSQKLSLDILYNLWDNLIKINDPLFIHFILVALIKYNQDLLLKCHPNFLLKLIVSLKINSIDEMNKVIEIALELRKLTPYSFRLLSNNIGLLQTNNTKIKKNLDKYKPEIMSTMGILPSELLYANNKIICPDPRCLHNLKDKNGKRNSHYNILNNDKKNNKNHICEKCDMKIDKKFNFVIIDLRLFNPYYCNNEYEYLKMGLLSENMIIDKEELKSDNIDKLLSSRLLSIRGKRHIILMTSKTYNFSGYEEKFYSIKISKLMKKKILFGVIEGKKMEKKLNLEDAEKNLDLEDIYNLKEYDILRNIIISMKKNNFPYVSYLEGGFEALHKEASNHKLELFGHNKKKCKLCVNIKNEININKGYKKLNSSEDITHLSDELWKNQKVITEKELNTLFSDENNIIYACKLRKYKNKIYHKNDFEYFVAILFDKKMIEIYNYESKNEKLNNIYEHINKDIINNYYLGIKEENDKNKFVLRLFDDIQLKEIKKVSFNNEFKNIIILQVNYNENEKKEMRRADYYEIEIIFNSIEESKNFMNSIKKLKI